MAFTISFIVLHDQWLSRSAKIRWRSEHFIFEPGDDGRFIVVYIWEVVECRELITGEAARTLEDADQTILIREVAKW